MTLDDGIELCDDEAVALASYFAPRPQFAVPQYLFDHQTGTITNAQHTVTLAAVLPACDTEADLFVGGEKDVLSEITEGGPTYGDRRLGSSSGSGARSDGPKAWFTGGSKGCHQPDVTALAQCDGTVDVNLSNTGELSRYPVDFTIKAGDFDKTLIVGPGKAETVRVHWRHPQHTRARRRTAPTGAGSGVAPYHWSRVRRRAAPLERSSGT